MINEIKQDAEKRMQKTVEALQHDLTKIRTGHANASLLDHVKVDYYGTMTALNQIASINSTDARTLMVTPWEKPMIAAIEKAILNAGLGLNPAKSGEGVRVPMPPLTEERRKEMARVVRGEAEQARVAVRNIRRDANSQLKELVKEKLASDDDERRAAEVVQKLTDKFIALVDTIISDKEKDLLEV